MKNVLALLLGLVLISNADAVTILQPNVLEPGEEYRLMFVTSDRRNATSAEVADYDAFVQSLADSAPEVGSWGLSWQAVVSTPTIDARDHTGSNPEVFAGVAIYRLDGTQIFDDYNHMWDAGLIDDERGLQITELGRKLPFSLDPIFVWTGTRGDGTKRDPLGASGGIATTGSANGFAIDFLSGGGTRVEAIFPFYAISEVLVAVPEPSALCLLAWFLGLALCFRRHRR